MKSIRLELQHAYGNNGKHIMGSNHQSLKNHDRDHDDFDLGYGRMPLIHRHHVL